MSSPRSQHITARVTPEEEALFQDAATHLGLTVSEFIVLSCQAAARPVRATGWECRSVYLVDTQVVGIGEEPPAQDGLPLAACAYPVLGPRTWWTYLEQVLSRPAGS